MTSYMVNISLPEVLDSEFIRLIPYQRAYINRLMKKGIVVNYSLSADRRTLWVVVNAEDRIDANNVIGAFPIYSFIKYQIHNLLFHESNSINAPQFWLN